MLLFKLKREWWKKFFVAVAGAVIGGCSASA
jgi:hypothetical protein